MDLFRLTVSFTCLVIVCLAQMSPQIGQEMKNVKLIKQNGTINYLIIRLPIMFAICIYMFYCNITTYGDHTMTFCDITLASLVILFGSLRFWCYSVLGEMFTFNLMIKKDHKLIQTGPYKYLIHPSYTGQLGTLLSYTFLMKSYIIILFLCLIFSILPKRMKLEEEMMKEEFGEEYTDYVNKRWRLIPFIY